MYADCISNGGVDIVREVGRKFEGGRNGQVANSFAGVCLVVTGLRTRVASADTVCAKRRFG